MTPPELPREVVEAIAEHRNAIDQRASFYSRHEVGITVSPRLRERIETEERESADDLRAAITAALTAARESSCPHVMASGESRYCTLAERSDSNARVRALIEELRMEHNNGCRWIEIKADAIVTGALHLERKRCNCGAYDWNASLEELEGRLGEVET